MSDKWRPYSRYSTVLRTLLRPAAGHHPDRMAFRRTLYLCTALLAFTLGLGLGITIPVYVFPDALDHRSPRPDLSTRTLPKPSFVGVSFVVNGTEPEAPKRSGTVDGIYWSKEVENGLPRGYGEAEARSWDRFVSSNPVVKIENGCGRMQNRLVTFEGGVRACARYRQNTDQIQGELFSFYLGRELGLTNLAPSSPGAVDADDRIWSGVRAQMTLAQWARGRPLVLTEFIDDLEPARIPVPLRNTSRRLHPPDAARASVEKAREWAQWSDLVIFDYLTANLDRVVNNLYNLQWNPGMMEAPAHNLARHKNSKLLVFLDNESGLLHGYRLLDKYESYHSVLLDALCVFRRSTVDAISKLRSTKKIGELVNGRLSEASPNEILPTLPEKNIKILNDRLDRVYDQVSWCRKQYPDS